MSRTIVLDFLNLPKAKQPFTLPLFLVEVSIYNILMLNYWLLIFKLKVVHIYFSFNSFMVKKLNIFQDLFITKNEFYITYLYL